MKGFSANAQKRMVCVLLALCLLMPVMSASAYFVSSAGHSCTGHDCPICQHIKFFLAILATLEAVLLAVVTGVLPRLPMRTDKQPMRGVNTVRSLISLCVRMNN